MYLNEVGIESSQQYSFQHLILVAVLVVARRVTLAVIGIRHQPGFLEVCAELSHQTCSKKTVKRVRRRSDSKNVQRQYLNEIVCVCVCVCLCVSHTNHL